MLQLLQEVRLLTVPYSCGELDLPAMDFRVHWRVQAVCLLETSGELLPLPFVALFSPAKMWRVGFDHLWVICLYIDDAWVIQVFSHCELFTLRRTI